MMRFLLLESACNYLSFAGSQILSFTFFYNYESFNFLLLKNFVIYCTKIYGTKRSTSAGDFKFTQHFKNMLYFTLMQKNEELKFCHFHSERSP